MRFCTDCVILDSITICGESPASMKGIISLEYSAGSSSIKLLVALYRCGELPAGICACGELPVAIKGMYDKLIVLPS